MSTIEKLAWLCRRERAAGVAILFALSVFPVILLLGVAIDLGFVTQSKAQMNAAADAAALAAAKTSADAFAAGASNYIALGEAAGNQWFNSQGSGVLNTADQTATVAVTQAGTTFSSSVTYQATLPTYFAWMVGYQQVPIGGLSSATITANSYVEVLMLLDNSSSMAIAATTADIVKLEQATMCSTLLSTSNSDATQVMKSGNSYNYSWIYNGNFGYGPGDTPPPGNSINGACDSRYTGAPAACFYPPSVLDANGTPVINAQGQCANGGGKNVKGVGAHTPQAPCAFACHTTSGVPNDPYALAKSLNITLRMEVVNAAAANVIDTLQKRQQGVGQFSVGVYSFSTTESRIYPTSGASESDTDLATAKKIIGSRVVPPAANDGDTNFGASVSNLLSLPVLPAGNGASQSTALKNLFIVTDGMQDTPKKPSRTMGPITSATNEQTCQRFKTLGFNVFVLYTPYLPLPNQYYLDNDSRYAEPGAASSILAALQACASSPANFFQASDPAAINTAMQQMLKVALASGGRFTN